LEIFTLAASVAPEAKPVRKDDLWWLVGKILKSVKQGEHGLHIVEYPTYRLKGPARKSLPGRRYVRVALVLCLTSSFTKSLDFVEDGIC
jgi:hypothetical protein